MTTCSSCRFWQSVPTGNFGECRRRSPACMVTDRTLHQQPTATWPATHASDWCGDHAEAHRKTAVSTPLLRPVPDTGDSASVA